MAHEEDAGAGADLPPPPKKKSAAEEEAEKRSVLIPFLVAELGSGVTSCLISCCFPAFERWGG